MSDPLDNVTVPSIGPTAAVFPADLEAKLDKAFQDAMIETDVREKALAIIKDVVLPFLKA